MSVHFYLDPVLPRIAPAIELDRPMIVAGSHPACDAVAAHPSVSRHHCCITVERGVDTGLVVRDLGSAGGIYVNGRKTKRLSGKYGFT